MSKNEFEKCKKYLHLSDNNNIDMVDRFGHSSIQPTNNAN